MKRWWLLVIFALLLVSSVSAQTSRMGTFTPFGANFGDVLNNILDWFTDNPGWVDALALLVIFLVVGKNVFMQYFKSKALYVTVAVALTVGVLLWERQTGISLILNSGPAGLVVILLAAFFFLFYMIRGFTGMGFVAFAVTYGIFYYYLTYLTNYTPDTFPDWFYRITDFLILDWGWLMTIVLFVLIAIAVIHMFKTIFGFDPTKGEKK